MSEQGTGMNWDEDANFWNAIDGFAHLSWIPLKELLDVLYEHRDEFGPQANAIIFGGVGKFIQTYIHARSAGASEVDAFNDGVRAIQRDPRVKRIIESSANLVIDTQVDKMKGGI